MREKINRWDYDTMKLTGPIFKKKIYIDERNGAPARYGQAPVSKEVCLFFFMRSDGALICTRDENAPNTGYMKRNNYIFKFENGVSIKLNFSRVGEIVLKRNKTPEGLAMIGEIYKYPGSYYRKEDYKIQSFDFLSALDVKLIRAARDSYRRKLKKEKEK